MSRPNARTRGLFCPHERSTAKKCVASPSSHFDLLHSNMRTKETRKADETTKRQPARLSPSRFTRLFIYLFPAEQTPELFRRPRHTLFHPLAIEAIPFVVGKKKGNATGAISISIRVTNVFLSRLFWGPFFLFFSPLKFFLSSTLLPYVLSIFGRRRGSRHNALGPPVVVFRVSSPPARDVPFFRIERIIIIIFFSLRIIRSSRGDGFRARGRHGYREQRTARSHSRP